MEQVISLLTRSLQAQQETVKILNDLSGKLAGGGWFGAQKRARLSYLLFNLLLEIRQEPIFPLIH